MPVISQRKRCYDIFKCFFPFLNHTPTMWWNKQSMTDQKEKEQNILSVYTWSFLPVWVVIPLFMLLLGILWPFCYYIPFIFSHFHQIKPLCRNNQAASKKSAPCPLIPFALSSTTDNRSSTISHFPFSFTLPLHCPPPPQNKPNNHNTPLLSLQFSVKGHAVE